MIKYVLLVFMINHEEPVEFAQFSSREEAGSYKVRLYEWNKRYPLSLREKGWDVPVNWSEYDNRVKIVER